MVKFIRNRMIASAVTMFVLITITFFITKLLPGNPFVSENMHNTTRDELLAYYGLDQPYYIQYFTYLKNLIAGNFGYSFKIRSVSVNQIIAQAFPYSLDLGIRSLVFATSIGIFLGIIAAYKRGKSLDTFTMIVAIVGTSVPSFVIGFFVQYIFAVKLRWFPVAQYDSWEHTILPTFTLGFSMLAVIAKYMRTSMLEVIHTDYVKTADSKGLSKTEIIFKHQIRNALLPIVTLLGPLVAEVITGTFIVENIFAVPGLGRHFVTSIQNLDYSLILGLTIFFAAFLIFMNLIVDIVYGIIDPRIKVE